MLSLLNPYILLGIVLTVLSAFGGGYWKGGEAEIEKQRLEIAKLNEEARQKEQALVAAVNTQAVQLVKANNEAKVQITKRNADIAAGVMRLRIPVSCPVQASGDAPAASGANLGTAELQPATAQAVLSVGDDADATVRKLNTCITLYNQVRETLKGQK
jgi:cobalamin biosynthesis Mg chelatase CobN